MFLVNQILLIALWRCLDLYLDFFAIHFFSIIIFVAPLIPTPPVITTAPTVGLEDAVLFDNKSSTRQQSLYNFLPTQFIFPQDYKLFRRVLEANETLPANERKVYIYKPNAGNSGKGIMLIRGVDDMESFEQDNVFKNIVFKGVVQEYLENPFTFPDKLKFDFDEIQ